MRRNLFTEINVSDACINQIVQVGWISELDALFDYNLLDDCCFFYSPPAFEEAVTERTLSSESVGVAVPRISVPVPETEIPVLRINYTKNFRLVYDLYRGILKSQEISPRFMLLTVFALKECPANYTVWKHRRDVILSPQKFAECCHYYDLGICNDYLEGTNPVEWRPPQPSRSVSRHIRTRRHVDPRRSYSNSASFCFPQWLDSKLAAFNVSADDDDVEDDHQNILRKVHALLICFSPAASHALLWKKGDEATVQRICCVHVATPIMNSIAYYDVWRAVAWELCTMRYAVVATTKSFQTWNHRRELLQSAALISGQNDINNDAMQTEFSDEEISALTFANFDERTLCFDALMLHDSKNYHAWSHRAWFVNFTGLAQTKDGIVAELTFVNDHLVADPWNNSAWSHRAGMIRFWLSYWIICGLRESGINFDTSSSTIFRFPAFFPVQRVSRNPEHDGILLNTEQRRHLLSKILQATLNEGSLLSSENFFPAHPNQFDLAESFIVKQLPQILQVELKYAEDFMLCEPRNECPFNYFVGIFTLWEDLLLGTVGSRQCALIPPGFGSALVESTGQAAELHCGSYINKNLTATASTNIALISVLRAYEEAVTTLNAIDSIISQPDFVPRQLDPNSYRESTVTDHVTSGDESDFSDDGYEESVELRQGYAAAVTAVVRSTHLRSQLVAARHRLHFNAARVITLHQHLCRTNCVTLSSDLEQLLCQSRLIHGEQAAAAAEEMVELDHFRQKYWKYEVNLAREQFG